MKHVNRKLIFLFLLIFPLVTFGQKSSLDLVMEIGAQKIAAIEGDYYNILLMEYDLLNEAPFKKVSQRNLFANRTYIVEAFGDPQKITDVDVSIFFWQGDDKIEIAVDRGAESEAKVTFKTESTGLYQVEITAYRFVEGFTTAYYGMLIYQE